jgi:hypothetical protein
MAGEPRERLAAQIENLDSQLVILDRTAAIIASILFLSYRVGLDSVGVSQYLGCVKPPMVRQVIFRCRKLAARLKGKLTPARGRQAPEQRNGLPHVDGRPVTHFSFALTT